MKQKTPLVSVLMTAYNAAEFVVQAVESIQNQTYSNWELIIVNDGSSDTTGKMLHAIASKDKRIRVVHCRKNRGASYASNLGLAKARGQYIARMDADDIAMPDRLSKQIAYLQKHKNVIVVGGQCELIDIYGSSIGMKNFPTKHKEIYDALYQINPIQHPSLMINMKLLGAHKITYHTDVMLAHDLEILFKLAQYGRLANLEDVVLKYRVHNDSLSLKHPKETFRHTLTVRQRGVSQYGYIPSLRGTVINFIQRVVLSILPSEVVYPLFRIVRMKSPLEIGNVLSDSLGFVGSRLRERWTYASAAIVALTSR